MNQTFQKIVGGVLAVTALMGLSACGSKTEDTKAEGKTYKVGIVQFVDDASLNQIEAAIEAELDAKATELGVKFDYTLYNGQADGTTLNQIGAELVSKGVDLIVPIATPAVKIMQSATEDTEIPIVFSAVSDPVGAGIVDSLDAPGGRITGTEVTAEHPEGISEPGHQDRWPALLQERGFLQAADRGREGLPRGQGHPLRGKDRHHHR